MLESITQDVRYGLRQLKQSPGFTLTAVLSLALSVGANTAIFQLVDAIRLKMLPVRNPQELGDMGIQEVLSAPRCLWQRAYVGRVVSGHVPAFVRCEEKG